MGLCLNFTLLLSRDIWVQVLLCTVVTVTATRVRAKGSKQRALRCLPENEDRERKDLCVQVYVREMLIEIQQSPMCSFSHKTRGEQKEEFE